MRTIDIPLLPMQMKFKDAAFSGALPHVCYRGGLGSGKTYAAVLVVALLAMSFGRTTWIYCAKSYPQLRDAVLPEFRAMLADLFDLEDYHWSKTDKTARFSNGSRLLFRSADASESLKSTNPDGILFEEVTDWAPDDFDRVYARARSTNAGEPRRLFVYNPRPGWFQDRVDGWIKAGRGVEFVAPTTENIYLPDSYADNLIETYGGKDSALVRRMVMGENIRYDGLVYPAFCEDTHVRPGPSTARGTQFVAGIDFGYSPGHSFAYLLGVRMGADVHVIEEHVAERMLLGDHAARIKEIESRHGVVDVVRYADHDAQDRAELEDIGIETTAASKDVGAGILSVAELVSVKGNGRPNLFVSPVCKNTVKEFGLYEWDKGARNDRPRKDFDHCMDALRYMVHSSKQSRSAGWVATGSRNAPYADTRGALVL